MLVGGEEKKKDFLRKRGTMGGKRGNRRGGALEKRSLNLARNDGTRRFFKAPS